MRRVFVISIVLNMGSLSVFLQTVNANDTPSEGSLINGDVNCSGAVDMSDAIRILNWLFIGGDGPCPLADPPELVEQIEQDIQQARTILEPAMEGENA